MTTSVLARRRPITYRYRAVDGHGTVMSGTVKAADAADAAELLRVRGLFPLRLSPLVLPDLHRRSAPEDVAAGLRILSSLLESGLPMARALAAFETLAPHGWRAASGLLRERIRAGGTLAAALADELRLPHVLTGVIAAGEASGALAEAVRRAAELAEDGAELRSAIRGALVYPAILLTAGVASVALLVGVVLPRFAAILTDLGQRPPAVTQLVLDVTAALRASSTGLFVTAILAIVTWRAWTSTATGRRTWSVLLLKMPGIGTIRHAAVSSRVCLALAALLDSGIPIAPALSHAAGAAGDAAVDDRLRTARHAVMEGERLGDALKRTGALTEAALRLLTAGEESGRLGAMCAHAGRMEARRARETTRAAVRLLEPALILVFGGLVAIVAAALLQAVYTVRPAGG